MWKSPDCDGLKNVSFCVTDVYIPNFKFPSSEVKQRKVKMQNRLLQPSTFPQIRMNGSSKNHSKFLFYCDFEFLFIYRITTTPNVKVLTSHNSRHILQIKKEFKQTLLSEFVQSVGRFWALLKCKRSNQFLSAGD